MIKAELELKYFPVLENDLNHLLQEKMRLVKKQGVYKLLNKIEPIVKSFRELQKEFYEKHGEKQGENYVLPPDLSDKLKKELEELQDKKEKLTFSGLTWDDIKDITSDYPYFVLMKILIK